MSFSSVRLQRTPSLRLHSAFVLVAIAGVIAAGICAAEEPAGDYPVPEPQPVASPLLVGSYYFPGHFNAMRWVPMAAYGHPYPLLGYYRDGEPEVSDWHIKWAVEHGIDFFAFDWYYDYKTGNVSTHNNALDLGFLRARYRDLMSFCIFWCNEERGEVDYTEEQMALLARTLRDRYLKQPNYLRIDGAAVLMVSCPDRLIKRFGVDGCKSLWEMMSREAGTPLYPIAKQHTDQATLSAAGFRACTAYNYAGANMPAGQRQASYDTMAEGYETKWQEAVGQGVLPYMVPVSPGWDSRPWYGDTAMVRTNPRPEKFRKMCEAAKAYVHPKLQAVIAECWNEFGEGSYIEPCTQYGFGYLDALRDAFCPDSPHHLDLTPQQLGRTNPVFADIPVLTERDIAAQEGNLVYNPGFEKTWGWVYFRGEDARREQGAAHSGDWAGVVTLKDGGMKSAAPVPLQAGDEVEIWAWVRTEPGATATVSGALFRGASWLGTYRAIGAASGPEWTRVAARFTWDEKQADRIDIEIAPRDGTVWVDDVGIRKIGAR